MFLIANIIKCQQIKSFFKMNWLINLIIFILFKFFNKIYSVLSPNNLNKSSSSVVLFLFVFSLSLKSYIESNCLSYYLRK